MGSAGGRFGRLMLSWAALSILVALLALAGLSWAYVSSQSDPMAMSAMPGFEGLVIFLATWVAMMAAMMFPSVAPVVLVYAQYTRQQGGAWPMLSALFVAGYMLVWSALGIVAYLLVVVLAPIAAGSGLVQGAPHVPLGLMITAAGLYQLTPLKRTCLGHCRSPLHLLLRGFLPGAAGALRMGLKEGVFCLGCCAGLMIVLLGVGLSSVGWMAAVATVIFIEKVLAPTPAVAKGVAMLLVGFGIAIATVPAVGELVGAGPRM